MTTKYTLNSGLAFLAITGMKRGLHINTRIAMTNYTNFQCDDLTKPCYSLNEAGWERAKKSRLWKAHCRMVELGYRVSTLWKYKPGFIRYHKDDQDAAAFTGAHGRTYIPESPERKFSAKFDQQFFNG